MSLSSTTGYVNGSDVNEMDIPRRYFYFALIESDSHLFRHFFDFLILILAQVGSLLTVAEKTNLLQTIKPLVPGTLYTIEPIGYEVSRWWVDVTPDFAFPQMRTKTDRRDGIYLATVSKTAQCSEARGGAVVNLGMDQRSEWSIRI